MDELIDENINNHALIEQKESSLKWRNIGLGVMGVADTFAMLRMTYGSEESIEFLSNLMKRIFNWALKTSVDLAKIKGSFPGYESSVWDSTFVKNNVTEDLIKQYKKSDCLRNSTLLSIAPNGSLSTMLNISGGIEPWFSLNYTRKTVSLNGKYTYYKVNVKTLQDWYNKFRETKVLPQYFITSRDIPWKQRVKLQGKVNEAVDTGISSTVNLPKETTSEQIEQLYLESWLSGCKGMTIFVAESREAVLSVGDSVKLKAFTQHEAPKRPKSLKADYTEVIANGVKYGVAIGLYEDKPYEIFVHKFDDKVGLNKTYSSYKIVKLGKRSYSLYGDNEEIFNLCENLSESERAITILCSMLLRHGAPIKYVTKTARKVDETIVSFSSAICRVLNKYVPTEVIGEVCPDCGAPLVRTGGCIECKSCGYSKCMFFKQLHKFKSSK